MILSGRVRFVLPLRPLAVAFAVICCVAVDAYVPLAAAPADVQPGFSASADTVGDNINKYCVPCHSLRLKTGGLALEGVDVAHVGANADVWEKVARKLRSGAMPPAGARRPDQETYDATVRWLAGSLGAAAAAAPNPGRPVVHRLNRAEYANAVRDLLAVPVDASMFLPPDDSAQGFDNVADVLGVSPSLLEGYLTAAARI